MLVEENDDCHTVRDQLQHLITDPFQITHTTPQVERHSNDGPAP
ncbi:hypothetical protein [Actinocatenispora rupis]|nr:hypothetical protein [Actinocatenispora rupis]